MATPSEKQDKKALDKSLAEMTRIAILRQWMDSLGGNLATGDCKLKSAKISRGGRKLTIVLKKKRAAIEER